MRNYFFSILVHIILFLLLLFTWISAPTKLPELESVIIVDFGMSENDIPKTASASAAATPVKKETAAVKSSPEKHEPQPTQPPQEKEDVQLKAYENESPITSQKQKTPSPQPKPKEPVKEIVPSIEDLKKIEEEKRQKAEAAEKARKEEEKKEKVSHFTSLFNKSKEIADAAERTAAKTAEANKEKGSATGTDSSDKGSNIEGAIGNRRVLHVPTINDSSQKQGRVVVKICVDGSGNVTSAKYTQVGSTTADSYLIGLAEKGAKEYKFSSSSVDRECGRVIIDFRLRA